MSEYISREAAIASLCCDCSATGDCRPGERCVDYQRLKDIPAADVKPVVHGSWLVSSTELHYDDTCSACGESFYSPIRGAYIIHHANFCPNCGADMRGET